MASSLVVLKFDTPEGADKGLELAISLQKQQLLQLLDAAIVTWPQGKKKPKTRHLGDMTAAGALDGAFWGFLFGLIFFVPSSAPPCCAPLGKDPAHHDLSSASSRSSSASTSFRASSSTAGRHSSTASSPSTSPARLWL